MRRIVAGIVLTLTVSATAMAAGYNFVEPSQFKQWLTTGKKVAIVDIQVPDEFKKHHLPGAVETNAFPAKSAEERRRLDAVVAKLAATKEDIVVVCPRGGGGAKNTCEYLKEKGISEKRTYILKDGMLGWPYKELSVAGR
jgi:rhodanese-related sulfurtransferase